LCESFHSQVEQIFDVYCVVNCEQVENCSSKILERN